VNSSTVGIQASVIPCGPNAGAEQTNPLARSWTLSASQASSGVGAAGTVQIFGDLCLDVRNGVNEVSLDLFPACILRHFTFGRMATLFKFGLAMKATLINYGTSTLIPPLLGIQTQVNAWMS
jgi:hypothetical protein